MSNVDDTFSENKFMDFSIFGVVFISLGCSNLNRSYIKFAKINLISPDCEIFLCIVFSLHFEQEFFQEMKSNCKVGLTCQSVEELI